MSKSLSYKEAPSQPPFSVSSVKYDLARLNKELSGYHKMLIGKLLGLDPVIGYGYRQDLVGLSNEAFEDETSKAWVWKETVYTESSDSLRNLITQIENHIQIVKQGGQV